MTHVFFGAGLTVVVAACHAPGQIAVNVNAKPVHHYVFFGDERDWARDSCPSPGVKSGARPRPAAFEANAL